MFDPKRVPHGPGRKTRLLALRETIGVDECGKRFEVSDNWTHGSPQPAMSKRWTGITVFKTIPADDRLFGGDQRRQRDRAGQVSSSLPRRRVAWADLIDNE